MQKTALLIVGLLFLSPLNGGESLSPLSNLESLVFENKTTPLTTSISPFSEIEYQSCSFTDELVHSDDAISNPDETAPTKQEERESSDDGDPYEDLSLEAISLLEAAEEKYDRSIIKRQKKSMRHLLQHLLTTQPKQHDPRKHSATSTLKPLDAQSSKSVGNTQQAATLNLVTVIVAGTHASFK